MKRPGTREAIIKALRKVHSVLAIIEEAAWEIDPDVASELLNACIDTQRALDALAGELKPTPENPA